MVDSYLAFVPEEAGHRKEAEQLLADEMLRMVSRDAALYPFKGSMQTEDVFEQDFFTDTDMDEASKLLRDEMDAIQASLKNGRHSSESLQTAWNEVSRNLIFDDDAQIFVDGQKANKEDRIAFARNEFETKRDRLVIIFMEVIVI